MADILTIWPKLVEYVGLSEYEAKVYLGLIGLGSSGARKLSFNCNVPRTKVYGTLKKLVNYDLVVEIPGIPKAFAPISPDVAFRTILDMAKSKAHDFSSIIDMLKEAHESTKRKSSPQKKVLWHLNEDDDIMSKCHEIISRSERKVVILTNAHGPSILFNYDPKLLDQLNEQGVDVKLYSPLDPKTNPLARELSYVFTVKKADIATPILFIDSDHRRFLLARMSEPFKEKPIKSAVFSDDPDILSLLSLLLIDGKKDFLLTTLAV